MILDPVTLKHTATVSDAKRMMKEFRIGGIPVVDSSGELLGIVTNRDLRFVKKNSLSVEDVMTRDGLIVTKENTTLSQAEDILQKHKIEKLPVVDDHNHLVGLITYRDIIKVRVQPNSNKDSYGRLRVAAAVGVTLDALDRVDALVEAGVDAVVVDTAHGHTKGVVNTLK